MRPSPSSRRPLIISLALHAALLGMMTAWASTGIPDRSGESVVVAELELTQTGEPEGPPAPPPPEPDPAPPDPPQPVFTPPPIVRPEATPIARREPPPKPVRRVRPTAAPAPWPDRSVPSDLGTAASATASETPRAVAGDDASLAAEYLRTLRARLERARVYPMEARDRGWSGAATVRFVIGRDGSVERLELVAGSGKRVLDEAALDAVRRASPFPSFPPELRRETLDLTLPVAFRLDDE